jgi:LysR family transcriptional regulator, low CO2-responsive transcriptional regulator
VTPTQLKAFAAIVRHGSAKAAAEELGISGAAISSHTAALRKELNDPLYHRSSSGLSFTPGGLRLAARAGELLGLQEQTRQEVLAASHGQRILRLATTSVFAEYAAPGLLELFKTRADDIEIEMSVHPGARTDELLASRQADVTIAPFSRLPSDSFRSCQFLKYELAIVTSASHPLTRIRNDASSLRSLTWFLGPSAVEPHGATALLLKRFAVPEQNQRIFQSHAAAISELQVNGGISILPDFRVASYVANGSVKRISAPGTTAPGVWSATSLPSAHTTAVAAELMRFVTTPRAIRAMLSGSGANIRHFRPSVHITLWN